MSGRTVWVATLAFFLAVHGAAMSAEEGRAPRSAAKPGSVLALAGIEAGVAVHVLAGKSDRTVELGATGRTIVHGLAPDDTVTAAARTAISERGLSGLVSVETRHDLAKLPYANRLVNLVVVEDFKDATARGLAMKEVFRVVVPHGVVLVRGVTADEMKAALARDGLAAEARDTAEVDGWVRIAASRPAWMGEWTHGRKHDAGHRDVAEDRFDPAGLGLDHLWIQWLDAEHRPHDHGSMSSLVSQNGRFISISNAETYGWARDGFYWRTLRGRAGQFVLSVRDAYNGVVQWIRPWRGVGCAGRGGGSVKLQLVAAGDMIYTIEKAQVTASDARDGAIRFEVPLPSDVGDVGDILCDSGVVVVHMDHGDQEHGEIVALDAVTGKRRWEQPGPVRGAAADQGRLFVALAALETETNSESPAGVDWVRAIALDSGGKLWTKSAAELGCGERTLALVSAGEGQVMVIADRSKVLVLKGEDGSVVRTLDLAPWQPKAACRLRDYFLVRGDGMQLFNAGDGKSVPLLPKSNPSPVGRYACSPGAVSEDMFLAALASSSGKGNRPSGAHEFIGHLGVNITCNVGPVFANGLLYQPQQYCGCGVYGRTMGLGLVATCGVVPIPPREAFLEPGPLEKGIAFDRAPQTADRSDAWPAFRGNSERNCAATGDFTDTPAILWNRSLAAPPTNSLVVAASWRGQHFHNLTISAPVVAGGKAFVALVDEHSVVALDAATGETSWRFTANARVDSPPTVHGGLCLFGSRDGWVYCLNAGDGALVWRRRITPVDERVAIHGQLESRYPVRGSVLVDDGRGYATAGLSGSIGIMLWEFDPRTGQSLSYRRLKQGPLNDVLLKGPGGDLFMNREPMAQLTDRVSKGSGAAAEPIHLNSPQSGLLNTVRTQSPSCGDRGSLFLGGLCAQGWAWRENRMFGFLAGKVARSASVSARGVRQPLYEVEAPAVFALGTGGAFGTESSSLLWQTPVSNVTAMAAAKSFLVVAGPDPEMLADLAPPPVPAAERPKTDWAAVLRGEGPKVNLDPNIKAPVPIEKFPPAADPFWEAQRIYGDWEPARRDPLAVGGAVCVLDAATGRVTARMKLPAAVVQDGIAVAGERAFLALTDGSVVCLGRKP